MDKIKESIIVRGIASSVANMSLPSVNALIELFAKFGIKLRRDKDV